MTRSGKDGNWKTYSNSKMGLITLRDSRVTMYRGWMNTGQADGKNIKCKQVKRKTP